MKLKKLFFISILFCLTGCDDPLEELDDLKHLNCVNESYKDYIMSVDGIKIRPLDYKIDEYVLVTVFKNKEAESNNSPFYTGTFVLTEDKESHWFVGKSENVILSISRVSTGETSINSPIVEINGIDDIDDNLIFAKETDFKHSSLNDGIRIKKFYNGDGSLLYEKIANSGYVYSGPMPYKEATTMKCYRFLKFESDDETNFYPQFEEVNVQDVLSYERSNDNSFVSVSIKSGQNIGSIKISPTYFNLPVTKIPSGGFKNLANLVILQLPTSIEEIGDEAFRDCINLREIINSERNIKFGKRVFQNTGLRSFTLSKDVDAVPSFFLADCKKLKVFTWQIEESNAKKYFYENAFAGCSSLLKLPCSEFVSEFYGYVLSGTSSLKYMYLNAKLKMYNFALSGCSADGFVKGSETSEFIMSHVGYSGKIRYYSETRESWANSDDYWHFSDEGYPISWGY